MTRAPKSAARASMSHGPEDTSRSSTDLTGKPGAGSSMAMTKNSFTPRS